MPEEIQVLKVGSNVPPTDVLVVGAGPTGLMAAALLLRSGIGVRIVDASPTAAKESRAFGIQARSMELFASIGLAEKLLDRGLIATGAEIYVDGHRAAHLEFDEIGRRDTPYQFLLMVPQSEIEAVLAEEVERLGVEVERETALTAFRQDDDGVAAIVEDPSGRREIHARYLIGADGAHSVVRKALGLSFEGGPYAQTFLLADCRVDWPLDHDHFKIMVRGRTLGLFLPLKGRETSRIMAADPHPPADHDHSVAGQGSSAVSLPEVEAAFREAAGLDVALSEPVWTSRYRIHHRGVDRYRVGRAFVAGDAAHIHSPAGGQGMNTGLQDAANLAWKLSLALRGRGGSGLLDSYHAERWPVGDRVLSYTDRLFSFMTAQSGWIAALRNTVFPAVAATATRLGFARNRAFHFISQLGIRYEPGPFVAEEVSTDAARIFRDGPAAGHRAPNAAIARHLDVFDLIGGYRFHVLALSRVPLGEAEVARLDADLGRLRDAAPPGLATHLVAHSLLGRDARLHQAESREAFLAYGLDGATTQALYLVRPDGYVAWRRDRLDVAACGRFLAERFGA